jgi:hypothetical protein
MAGHIKEISTGVNVSKSIRQHNYDLYFKTVVIKYAKEGNSCEGARNYSVSQGKHPEMETTKTRTYASST